MQNGDEASRSIDLAGRALLLKILITLEPHGMVCFYQILLASIFLHCPDTGMQNKDQASPSVRIMVSK